MHRPLIEAVRPRARTPHRDLRRTVAAIIWRHRNGATWRSIPAELGPWWAAAQTFIHWARLGVCVSPSSPCDDERVWLMSLTWWTTQTRQRNS